MTVRRDLERRSGPALVILGRLPRALPFLVVLALLLGGLAVKGVVGAVLLLVLLVILSWITFLAWPALRPPARALRVGVLVLVAGAAVAGL